MGRSGAAPRAMSEPRCATATVTPHSASSAEFSSGRWEPPSTTRTISAIGWPVARAALQPVSITAALLRKVTRPLVSQVTTASPRLASVVRKSSFCSPSTRAARSRASRLRRVWYVRAASIVSPSSAAKAADARAMSRLATEALDALSRRRISRPCSSPTVSRRPSIFALPRPVRIAAAAAS